MHEVAEKYYPDVEKIIIVADNLNTHAYASFYDAYKPSTTYWLSQKYEIHYTSKHGSWLNIAETELSSLSIQCQNKQRIKNTECLNEMLSAWEGNRSQKQKGVNWQFTIEDTRGS